MKILIADDHTIVRTGIKMLLMEAYPLAEIADVSDSAELLKQVQTQKWDVVISDISMPPGESGIEAIQKIKQNSPSTPVIILSMHSPEHFAVKVMRMGASGYLTKSAAALELINAVNRVLAGKKYVSPQVAYILANAFEHIDSKQSLEKLSDREMEVFKLLASGKTSGEIAKELSLSSNTISTFKTRISDKMGFHNNVDLIKFAIDNQLV